MRLIIVTCGTSVTQSSRCWQSTWLWARAVTVADLRPEEMAQVKAAHGRMFSVVADDDLNRMEQQATTLVEREFERKAWSKLTLRTLSAELATLFLVAERGEIAAADRVLLVTGRSNRKDGAIVRAVLLRLAQDGTFPTTQIELIEPIEWDPNNTDRFNEALDGLWNTVNTKVGTHPLPDEVTWVLTGGYKGVLIDLALRIGALAAAPTSSLRAKIRRIYYLFEGSPSELMSIRLTWANGEFAARHEPSRGPDATE